MSNLASKLASEIARVGELRGKYAGLDGTVGINVKPVMFMIDRALKVAAEAAAGGDIVEMARAVNGLEEFRS